MKYKITFKNHLKSLEHLIYSTLLFPVGIYYVYINDGYTDGIPIIFGISYSLIFIPTLFLHIQYYMKNKNDVLIINISEKTICINEQNVVAFNEIEKIIYVMPPVWHRKGFIRFLSFEDYHYARIKMKSGQEFIFTCLMNYKVEDALKQIDGVPVEKRKSLLATTLIG